MLLIPHCTKRQNVNMYTIKRENLKKDSQIQLHHKTYANITSVKNQLVGLFQSVNLAMTNNIVNRIECRTLQNIEF